MRKTHAASKSLVELRQDFGNAPPPSQHRSARQSESIHKELQLSILRKMKIPKLAVGYSEMAKSMRQNKQPLNHNI